MKNSYFIPRLLVAVALSGVGAGLNAMFDEKERQKEKQAKEEKLKKFKVDEKEYENVTE